MVVESIITMTKLRSNVNRTTQDLFSASSIAVTISSQAMILKVSKFYN